MVLTTPGTVTTAGSTGYKVIRTQYHGLPVACFLLFPGLIVVLLYRPLYVFQQMITYTATPTDTCNNN